MAEPLTLEDKVQRLLDIEAIKTLQARYLRFADVWQDRQDPDSLSMLFTEDGVLEAAAIGSFIGRKAISKGLREAGAQLAVSIHTTMMPIIEIDGDQARATWYLASPTVLKGSSEIMHLYAEYQDEMARTPDGWRFTRKAIVPFLHPAQFNSTFDD